VGIEDDGQAQPLGDSQGQQRSLDMVAVEHLRTDVACDPPGQRTEQRVEQGELLQARARPRAAVGGHPGDAPDREVGRWIELRQVVGRHRGVHPVPAKGQRLPENACRRPSRAGKRAGSDEEDARVQETWVVMARTRSWKS
jgi:hypothetical protein